MRMAALVAGSALIAGAVMFAAFSKRSVTQGDDNFSIAQHSPDHTSSMKSEAPGNSDASPAGISLAKSPTSTNYKLLLAGSHNYWDYAHLILPDARNGSPDAQFYLSKVIEQCHDEYKFYFHRRGAYLTLDEGLQYAVRRHLPIETAQAVYDRCHQFQDENSDDLGDPLEWLAKATESGQPIAEAVTASKMLIGGVMRDSASAAGVEVPDNTPTVKSDPGADPRALLRAAVTSRDPEVLLLIGDFQALLDKSQNDELVTRFAWWLNACKRGLDCSTSATWVKNSCFPDPQCLSATSPEDLIRYLAGDKWPDVQEKAQAIEAHLDSGEWSVLGLGP